ncbi:MAG: hypothetical protein ACE14T_11910 [Syntrophales bacterium]
MPETIKNIPGELIPPSGNPDVGKKVFQILAEIIKDKINLGLHQKWEKGYRLRKNKHWRAQSTAKVPLVSANLFGVHIQRTANVLTDNNPTFNVVQTGHLDEADKEKLETIQQEASHWWNETEQQEDLEESVVNGEQYGITIEKMTFNPELEHGLGEAESVIVDPFHFGVYPVKWRGPKQIQNRLAVLHFYPMTIREIQRKWAEKAAGVRPDEEYLKDLGEERREINSQTGTGFKVKNMLVEIANTVHNLINFGGAEAEKDEEALVVECWVKDYSKSEDGEPELDEQGQLIQNYKSKYPGNIRYIVCCNGGEIVLEDRPNPNINPNLPDDQARMTYLYDKFPFAAAVSQKDTSSGWGLSDSEQLEWLQAEFNKTLSQLIKDKDWAARSKIVNPRTSGVPNDDFKNYGSILRPVNEMQAAAIRYLQFQPSVDLAPMVALLKDLFFLVAGTFELDQAQTQGREVIAYKAIAALMERAAVMMRGKIRSYSRLIRERGRMHVSMVQNFYTEERWIPFRSLDGEDDIRPYVGSQLIVPAKLTVVTGSTLPVSKVQQREEALALYKERAIDNQELLNKLEWSNRAEVIKRMQAGPLGQLQQNLQAVGMPPQLIQLIANIAQIDPKKIPVLLQKGTVPDFQQIVSLVGQLMGGQPEEKDWAEEAETQVKLAQAKKLEAETLLTIEKIATERLNQEKTVFGVKFDKDMIKIKKAEIIGKIETEISKMVHSAGNKIYQERGAKSNNA